MPSEPTLAEAARLVERLREARRYPHPVADVELVETHISWVLLAGGYAYKLKKPLDLGFLDFSTLAKRRAACEEEVRLNRRLAPELYLDVVAVTGSPDDPAMGGTGLAVEYAVRMRRFDRALELDRLLARGELPDERIDELAALVARFHAAVPAAPPDGPYGTPGAVYAAAAANFEHLAALEHDAATAARIAALARWTEAAHSRLAPVMRERLAGGFVRECHGDLHLANMVLHEGRVVVFDCIEFNPALRWTDVAAEIAFTVMDLRRRGRPDLAQRFLNGYLDASGDYAGLRLLPYYLVYRAMVRAKVAAIRASQETDAAARERDAADVRAHLALAESFAAERQPALVITCGASGSGKSFVAGRLAATGDWIRIRSDVERKRLAGLDAAARTGSGVGAGLYTPDMTERTYARLAALARTVVAAGYPALVDATFLERTRREAFRALAGGLGVPFLILAPAAPADVMRERVAARERAAADPSEATLAVLERQLATAEPLAAEETAHALVIDAAGPVEADALATAVAARLGTHPPRPRGDADTRGA
ncbi:MAG: AAA family ATPase [Burkholderiales bacterium]|nr:AAA family ATPase [Burkholderiales bacterium]